MQSSRSWGTTARAQCLHDCCRRSALPQKARTVPSSFSRNYTVASRIRPEGRPLRTQLRAPARPNLIFHAPSPPYSYASHRLASTSTTRPNSAAADATTTTDSSSPFLPDSLEGLEERDPSTLSELLRPVTDDHVGFLKENYGIDFGWGVSSIMKLIFENVHVFGGFEFWGSIFITGIIARAICAPMVAIVSDNAAKMQAVSKLALPIQAQMKEAVQKRDLAARQRLSMELKQVYKRVGAAPWKSFLAFVQMPIGFGCWRVFSNLAHHNVAGVATGGTLWFTNLTIPDPFFILPLATSAMQYFSVKNSSETNIATDPTQRTLQKVVVYLPLLFLPIISFVPAAVQLHFLTTSTGAYLTNLAIRNPSFRSLIRMTPRITHAKPVEQSVYKGTINVSARSRPSSSSSSSSSASSSSRSSSSTSNPNPNPISSSPPSIPTLTRQPLTFLKNKFKSGMTTLNDVTDSMVPGVASRAREKAGGSAADRYEAKRSREIEIEREAYERRLEGLKRAKRAGGRR